MDNQTLILITATLAGIAVGALVMYFLSSKGSNSAKSVAQVEEKLTKYQEDVVTHFEQTADLVDDLTQSYKKVFDHLGQSARELLTDEQVKEQIEKRKDNQITLGFLTEEVVDVVSEKAVEDASNESFDEQANDSQVIDEDEGKLDQDVEELIDEIEVEMKKQEKQ